MPASGSGDDRIMVPSGPLNYEAVNQLIQDAIVRALGPATIALLARTILEKVSADTAIQLFHPATVIADKYDGTSHTATLSMDQDPPGVDTYAAVLVPTILFPGQRVMVWFDKPHIAYVLGVAQLGIPPVCRVSNQCSSSSG